MQGVQGPQGPQGFPGATGPTGFQGSQGPQGLPNGAAGADFYTSNTRLNLYSFTTASTLAFSNGSASTYYNITSTTPLTVLSNASPGATSAGAFWVFRNNTSALITVTGLVNMSVTYAGATPAYVLYIGSGNAMTLVSAGGSSFIAF